MRMRHCHVLSCMLLFARFACCGTPARWDIRSLRCTKEFFFSGVLYVVGLLMLLSSLLCLWFWMFDVFRCLFFFWYMGCMGIRHIWSITRQAGLRTNHTTTLRLRMFPDILGSLFLAKFGSFFLCCLFVGVHTFRELRIIFPT